MEQLRYTKFPDLSPPLKEGSLSDVSYLWDVDFQIPEELLTLSWASLLQSYTGNQKPIFIATTDDVEVDVLKQTISKVKTVSSECGGCEWTGIFLRKVSKPGRSILHLQYDAEQSHCSLESSGYVPHAQLKQIAYQLEQIWTTRLGLNFNSSYIALSTANLEPRVLEGPKLLHELPRFLLGDSSLAVEFLNLDGTLCGYSYQSIDRLSTTLASQLRRELHADRPIRDLKNPIIPVLIPQSPELYITLLAILKAGAAFCPLNPDAPEERIKFVVQDVSARVIATTRALEKRFAWTNRHVVMAVDESGNGYDEEELTHLPKPNPTHLAYVMYTSGSTGSPKGVAVSHFAVTQSLLAHDRHIPHFNRFLQFAAPTFDVFVFEMFFPLFRGSTLVGCSRDKLLNDLPRAMNRLRVDAAELTPSVAGELLQKRSNAPGLQVLLTIGEMLTSPVTKEFGSSSTAVGILHGMYGPTEAAIHCTLATNFQTCSRVGIIGVPLDTVSALIIAPQDRADTKADSIEVLPMGQVGELAIGGYQLADGYLNRLEQSSHSFIETRQYGRLYRTGDRARLLSDGCLEFLGRVSFGQVKLRGQRVELGEIEQVACRTNGVNHAAASIIDGTLVVFCSADSDRVSARQVLDNCNQWLPKFMIPADVVLVRDLPRLPSAKIDRHRLDSEYLKTREALYHLQDVGSEIEQKVSDAVRNLLGTTIGRSASLAAAGLDSLLAIRLSSQLRMLGFDSSATEVLKADTIKGIGQISGQSLQFSGNEAELGKQSAFQVTRDLGFTSLRGFLSTAETSEIVPCTPLQTVMLTETTKDSKAYCNWIELEIHLTIRPEDIKVAFKQLALRNEILRSGFIELEGTHSFAQVVWKDLPDTCFLEVSEFTYNYELGNRLALLRPLRIQIREGNCNSRVLVQIHHALYDGWSWELITDDLERVFAGQRPQDRPPYRKLVEFYLRPSTTTNLAISREFWQGTLCDVTSCTLPNLNGRKGIKPALDSVGLHMSSSRAELESISRKLLVSPQAFFQAAFAYLLSSYLGRSDVVFGVVLSGRTFPIDHIEDIIGPFIATTPFRIDVSDSRTVRDLVQSTHKRNRKNLEHCALPLRDIRQSCGLRPGDILFDALMVYQQILKPNVVGKRLVSQVDGADYLEFNLTLEIEPGPDRVYLKANYQRAVIPKGQVDTLLNQLDQLVTTFIRSELMPLSQCRSCFSSNTLSIENPNPQRRRNHDSLPSYVEHAAQEFPEGLAVEFYHSINDHETDAERLSYRELNMRANRVAHRLISLGVLPDELVCIYMEKCIDLYISILAAAKAGAGYLPLTPDTPKHRILHILTEARVKQCLTHSTIWKALDAPDGVFGFCLDKYDPTPFPVSDPVISYQPSNLAYAVFTSGTTGKPKGILVTQENLLSNLEALRGIYPVEKGSRLLQSCSQAFDVSVFEIYFAWCSRICLCSTTKNVLFRDIERAIKYMRISYLSLTPTVAALVDSKNVPNVRFLITAGEALTQKVLGCWADRGLYQGYGPSETTNICTVKKVSSNDFTDNIGIPFSNTSVFVAYDDDNLTLVPRGGVGEFCFGGDQVCRGYLNMPELTSKKFINHPQFGRLYRSGDYGRLRSDGSLQFVGRRDDQVKVRGQRVELGEIDGIMLNSSMVLDCTTLLITESNTKFQQIVCFWVPGTRTSSDFKALTSDPNIKLAVGPLFDSLVSSVPVYMVPSFLVPVSSLPMTDQGKTDKRGLTTVFQNLSPEYLEFFSRQSKAPGPDDLWSDLGREIACAVAHVTNTLVVNIRPSTSFFSLGLDSISAISLSRILRRNGHNQLEVSAILRHPTVSSLCKEISRSSPLGGQKEPKPSLENAFGKAWLGKITKDFEQAGRQVQNVFPCTPLQEAMLSKTDSKASVSYYNHTAFEIYGDLDRLRDCWDEIALRNDILRTCFLATDSPRYAFAQVVLKQCKPAWSSIETSALKVESRLKDLMTVAAPEPSEYNPPYKFTSIRSPHRIVLLLSMHHALYDGVAMQQLLEEVQQTYLGNSLPPVVPFELFLDHVISLDLKEAGPFWEAMLKGFRPSPFPEITGKPLSFRKALIGSTTARFKSTMSLSFIENYCKRLSISFLALGQLAWAKLLAAYLGEHDVCFGNVVSGRTIPLDGVERIVAPCFNTLPVRVQFTHDTTNLELIEFLQNANVDSLPYQLTPLRYIQSKYSKDGLRIFDTVFILQHPQRKLDGQIWSVVEDTGDMEFPIICEVVPNHHMDTVELVLHCHRSLVSKEDSLRILQTFDATLGSCLSYPANSATDFGFLDRSLLSVINEQCGASGSSGMLLHLEFERVARERPLAMALDFLYSNGERVTWTFQELNYMSNQVAHILQEHGVSEEEVVPICMHKSPIFYAGILGILKAGAAFTPIDPQSTASRKNSMVKGLQSRVLLSHSTTDTLWCDLRTIALDDENLLCTKPKDNPPTMGLSCSSLAYRLYRPGSTCESKAVDVKHQNAAQTIECLREVLPWTSEARLLQYAATTSHMCYFDCFVAWSFGFCLCSGTQSPMLKNLTSIVSKMSATVLHLTPAVASSLSRSSVPSVQYIYCTGEAIPQRLAEIWVGKLVNLYESTETGMCHSIQHVSPETKSTVIGSPFPSTSFTVLSKDTGYPIPLFGVGELHISRSQVAMGYHLDHELSRSRPTCNDAGKLLYKSGDIVRMLSGGVFEYIGRSSDWDKMRGFRVELDEINHALQTGHPDIKDAVTLVIRQSEGSKEQLVSFLAIRKPSNCEGLYPESDFTTNIKNAAQLAALRKLPAYMVPRIFVSTSNIPLSPVGKIDEQALVSLFKQWRTETLCDGNENGSELSSKPDRDEGESELCDIFSRFSGMDRRKIGRDTTIYRLGLDSISAVQIASELRSRGCVVSAADILQRPSIGQLAPFLKGTQRRSHLQQPIFDFMVFEQTHRKTVISQLGISDIKLQAVRPCTVVQAGMIAQFLNSDGTLYFNHLVMRPSKGAEVIKICEAWQSAMEKHDMLRTGFTGLDHKEHQFAMLTYRSGVVDLPLYHLDGVSDASNFLNERRRVCASEVLQSLHQPAWRLGIVQGGGETLVQFSAHHALYDAQSLQIILRDITETYRGASSAPAPSLNGALGVILSASEGNERKRFWQGIGKELLVRKFPCVTPLRVESKSSRVLSKICSKTRPELEASCKVYGFTVQAVGEAAWARILAAYTGDISVTFGLILSGRMVSGVTQDVAFPCLATVPISLQVQRSNEGLVRQIMEANSSFLKYQYTPLSDIQRWTGHAGEELFDTIFVYQKLTNNDHRQSLLEVIEEEAAASFAVSVELELAGDTNLSFKITFREDILPVEQARLLLNQLDAAMNDTLTFPEAQALDMSRLPSELLSVTPAKEQLLPSEIGLLHQFVEVQQRHSPKRPALEFATSLHNGEVLKTIWTYEELDAEGNKIANILTHHGALQADLIAICFDKCPEASFAILGILKAGCAFVALDPNAPIARKLFIAKDSQSKCLLTTRQYATELQQSLNIPVISLDDKSLIDSFSACPPTLQQKIKPSDVCYCLYTSGTTGTPKGCEITHENGVQAMLAFQRLFRGHWGPDSKFLQFASFHFDVSVLEQYWSWSVGICVSSAPRDMILEDISGAIQKLGITHIDLTPSLARLLHPDEVPSLCKGVFITGGEQLEQEILNVWGPKGVIYNGYGPTEATIGCTMFPRVPLSGKPSNIGPQFDNVGSYVFIPNSTAAAIRGGVGELCVSGKLVGRGYLNRPELTKERFQYIPDYQERVYRTGDLVRLLHDGTFDFLGRLDDQVKLRGQRLEIGEINETIKAGVDCVQEIATLVLQHPKQQKEQLVSFVVLKTLPRQRASKVLLDPVDGKVATKILDTCRAKLPVYMIPTHLVALNSIPLSANNKADVKQLRQRYNDLSSNELQRLSSHRSGSDRPSTGHETELLKALSKATGVSIEDINASSNIFELGLDSISVIRLARLLKETGFGSVRASVIMKNPTVGQLAHALRLEQQSQKFVSKYVLAASQSIAAFAHKHAYAISRDLGVSIDSISSIAPCTPLQEGMIFRSLDNDRPLYFGSFYFQLPTSTSIPRLKEAWKSTIARTQLLRTRFSLTTDGYAQVVMKKYTMAWGEVYVSNEQEREGVTEACYLTWWQKARDLRNTPFETLIIQSPTETIMCLHIFHALYDGNSLLTLLMRVHMEYLGLKNIDYGPPFQEILPYGPLCESEGAKEFWIQRMSDSQFHRMPPLIPNAAPEDSFVTVDLMVTGLEATRRLLNTTTRGLVQACWISVLRKYLGDSVTIGMVVSGRSIDFEGIENTIGPLFNTIPFHVSFEQTDTWASLVNKCHNFNIAALPHQHTALRDIIKWCGRTSDGFLFDTLFVFHKNSESPKHVLPDLWVALHSKSPADYPLAFEVHYQSGDILRLTIVAQGTISSNETSSQLLKEFEATIGQMVQNPNHLISTAQDKIWQMVTRAPAGVVPKTTLGETQHGYVWTTEARRIQEEVAALAKIDVSCVNETSSILELGLDSIDAIKLSSRLKRARINLSVSAIMKSLIISKIASQATTNPTTSKISRRRSALDDYERKLWVYFRDNRELIEDADQILPVTPLQEAMIAEMNNSNFSLYFNHNILQLKGTVDSEKLKLAWETVASNTAILRTSFHEVSDPDTPFSYAQIVHRSKRMRWNAMRICKEDDLRVIIDKAKADAMQATADGPAASIIMLEGIKERYLILSLAHALYDGWSLGLLHEDVRKAYHDTYLPRCSIRETLEHILSASSSEAAKFWMDSLSGVRATRFPSCQPNHQHVSSEIHHLEARSPLAIVELKSFCRAQGVTLQVLGQTCWAFVLASYMKSLEVVFGTILSGRDTESAHEVMFPTMNTVPIRAILHGTREEMLQYMQENISNILQYQHYPLRKAQASANLGGQRLFNTLFIYQRQLERGSVDDELYESVGGSSRVEYPVCVEMELVDDALVWRTACNAEIMTGSSAKELLNKLELVLEQIVRSPSVLTVAFTEYDVRICGLPAFIRNSESIPFNDRAKERPLHHHNLTGWSATELSIRKVLSLVSKVPENEISKDITLFHLGLDSISTIKASSLLRKQSIKLSVSDMLKAATIRKMASLPVANLTCFESSPLSSKQRLEERMQVIDTRRLSADVGIDWDSIESYIPASAGQVYMLSAWQNSMGSLFYPRFSYQTTIVLDRKRLDKAWRKLLGLSPILRTTFLATERRDFPFVQAIYRLVQNPIVWLSGEKQVSSRQPLNFNSPPVSLYACQLPHGTLLQLEIHHALYDGVSLPMLMQQLQRLYDCLEGQHSPILIKNEDFLALNCLPPEQYSKRRAFWETYLGSSRSLIPPKCIARKGWRVEVFEPGILDTGTLLESAARGRGLSVQAVFLAAYSKVHAKLLRGAGSIRDGNIAFGIYLANRGLPIEGLLNLPAPTLNLVPLRVAAPLKTSITDVAKKIQADLQGIGSVQNNGVGLWEIEEWTGLRINCFVNFLRLPDSKSDMASDEDGQVSSFELGLPKRKTPHREVIEMKIEGFVEPKALRGNITKGVYLPSLDIEATIRDGRLDIGVFCPEELLSLDEATRLIFDIREKLSSIGEDSECLIGGD